MLCAYSSSTEGLFIQAHPWSVSFWNYMTHRTSLMMGWLPHSLGSFIRPLLYTGLPQKNILWTWAGNWQKKRKMELWDHFLCLSGKGDKGRYDWVLAEQKECKALISKRGVDWFKFLQGNLRICGKISLKLHTFWPWTSTFGHVLNGMHFSFFIKTEFQAHAMPFRSFDNSDSLQAGGIMNNIFPSFIHSFCIFYNKHLLWAR